MCVSVCVCVGVCARVYVCVYVCMCVYVWCVHAHACVQNVILDTCTVDTDKRKSTHAYLL